MLSKIQRFFFKKWQRLLTSIYNKFKYKISFRLLEVLATVSPDTDRQQGVTAGSSTTLSASASIFLSSGTCNTITHLCGVVLPGTGASYTDPDDTNNAQCIDISARLTCSPGRYSLTKKVHPMSQRQLATNRNFVFSGYTECSKIKLRGSVSTQWLVCMHNLVNNGSVSNQWLACTKNLVNNGSVSTQWLACMKNLVNNGSVSTQ